MFHRFSGKTFIFVVGIVFALLSLQNTWDFLTKSLPGAQPQFLACMMIVFEGGVFGWLALLTHGAGNVPRVIISAIMLLICSVAVGIAAFFMLGNMLGTGLGYKIPPAILQWVPTVTIGAYLATGAALIFWLLANPEFHNRMKHINRTGQEPPRVRIIESNPFASALPQPRSETRELPPPAQGLPIPRSVDFLQRVGGWLGRRFGGQRAMPIEASEAMPEAGAEDDAQGEMQEAEQAVGASLDFVEKRMLDLFRRADPDMQAELLQMARERSASDVAAYLQEQYPNYARHITLERVRNVMAAYLAQVAEPEPEPEPQMQQSAPPRARNASARTRNTTAKRAPAKRPGDMAAILNALLISNPEASDAELARLAGCSQSTVSRWRASRGGR